jgi:hypothetical protein
VVATKTLPIGVLGNLGLHEGDTLQVLAAGKSEALVQIHHREHIAPPGSARAWLETARGSVKLAAGESTDDVRMAYYADKCGLSR